MSQDNQFKILNQELLRNSQSVLSSWFPSGVVRGREFVIGDLQGSSGDSLSINLDKGVWSDFATGQSGADLISLYAASRGITQGQALNDLGGKKVKTPKSIKNKETYRYTEDYYIERVDFTDGTKKFFGRYQGANKHHPTPRPLYFVEGFKPEKPILIVEGEKAAHAANKIIGEYYSVVTWPTGSNGFKNANWQSLIDKGAKVFSALIWPDFDEPGYKAAAGIAAILKPMGFDVSILDVKKNNLFPNEDGWDAHDVLQLNWTQQQFIDWAKGCKTDVTTFVEPPKEKQKKEEKLTPIVADQELSNPVHHDRLPEIKKTDIPEDNISHYQDIKGLSKTDSGRIIVNALNIRRIIDAHPALKNRFFYDEFFEFIFISDRNKLRRIEDNDVTNTMMFMQNIGLHNANEKMAMSAISSIAKDNVISQPKMEIDSFVWDGVPRINNFFKDYIVSSYPEDYLNAIGKNFWISMIARLYQPGCKVDTMTVLISKAEGIYKSTALSVIGGKYFSEAHGTLGKKDFIENSAGYFIIEDSELRAMKQLKPQDQKSFLSGQKDTMRKAFGRFNTEIPRKWIIVGSTNEETFIDAGESEGRRYWPVKVDRVEIEKLREDRSQLFAEALVRFKNGETWWEVPKESHQQVFNQGNEHMDEPWQENISDYIYALPSEDHGWVKTSDIFDKILGVPLERRTKKDANSIGKIMKNLGYKYVPMREDGRVLKVWKKDVGTPMPFRQSKSDASDGPYSNSYGW